MPDKRLTRSKRKPRTELHLSEDAITLLMKSTKKLGIGKRHIVELSIREFCDKRKIE